MEITVAIQGALGSFHEEAALTYFKTKKIKVVACNTFLEVFDKVEEGKVDCGMVAIENSVAGSILPNYVSLLESEAHIFGEIYYKVEQHIMALPGQSLEQISEIISHPVAIQQCHAYLKPFSRAGVKIVGMLDTARCAQKIRDEKLMGTAAIAGAHAAEIYKLEIIAKNIQAKEQNFTRFLAFANKEKIQKLFRITDSSVDKASICFTVCEKNGQVAHVLGLISFYRHVLVKIQSIPMVEVAWQYRFYVDITFDSYKMFTKLLQALEPITTELILLGVYKNDWKGENNNNISKYDSYIEGLMQNM